jgi:hypothetical protein
MANYIGSCAQCGESCDRDDPDLIVVTGEVDRSRLHIIACSLDHLARWATETSAQVARQRHIRENTDKHPLPGMLCEACPSQ